MFANATLAGRIERAEASLVRGLGAAARRRLDEELLVIESIGGGVAVHAGADNPANKVAGIGFEAAPASEEWDRIEQAYAAHNAAVRVELSSLASPEIGRLLTQRGYELTGYENLLGLALDTFVGPASVPGVSIATAERHELTDWIDVVSTGFEHTDDFDAPPSDDSFPRAAIERVFGDILASSEFEQLLARRDGELAGGASLRIFESVAQLSGAATLPAHRRRGVQTALVSHRLAEAARRGCDVAVVTTQPGSKSQQNLQRFGFAVLYVRAVLVKPAPSAVG